MYTAALKSLYLEATFFLLAPFFSRAIQSWKFFQVLLLQIALRVNALLSRPTRRPTLHILHTSNTGVEINW